MDITNTTGLSIIYKSHLLILRVVYDVGSHLILDKTKTYGVDLEDDIDVDIHLLNHTTRFQKGKLTEFEIRASQIQYNSQNYSAINSQSFWEFFKEHFGVSSRAPQTIAKFQLPVIKTGDTLKWSIGTSESYSFHFESFPWEILQKNECRSTLLSPQFHTIHFLSDPKQLEVILIYPTQPEGRLIIQHRASHE